MDAHRPPRCDQWLAEWTACFKRLRAQGKELTVAQRMAREITTARYGPQPPKPALWLRIGLKFAGRKLAGMIRQRETNMRWDKVLQGAGLSGLLTAALAAAPFFSDGRITGAEGIMLFGMFLGGVALYIKQHPPVEWDGTDRRGDSPAEAPKP